MLRAIAGERAACTCLELEKGLREQDSKDSKIVAAFFVKLLSLELREMREVRELVQLRLTFAHEERNRRDTA